MTRPVVDPNRCLRFRCDTFDCTRCIDACPQAAIRAQPLLAIDNEACTRCGLCIAACPADGIHHAAHDLDAVIATLARAEQPVLACSGEPATRGHARVPCLGVLAGEDLLALATLVPRPVRLDATRCGACVNAAVLPAVAARLRRLDESGAGGGVTLCEEPAELGFRDRECDRRQLFRSLVGACAPEPAARRPRAPLGGKHVPARRRRLPAALSRLPEDARAGWLCSLRIDPSCDDCFRCVGMCPTGALKRERKDGRRRLSFDEQRCSGCDLCAAFCPLGALKLRPAVAAPPQPAGTI